jgi:hypothetical protein
MARAMSPEDAAVVTTLAQLADRQEPWYQDGYGPIHVVRSAEASSLDGAAYVLTIVAPDSGRVIFAEVHGSYLDFGQETVKWSMGSQSPTDAMTYAMLLAAAAFLAPTAEGPTGTEA